MVATLKEEMTQPPKALPGRGQWMAFGMVATDERGDTYVNVLHVIAFSAAHSDPNGGGKTTGMLTTTCGVKFVTRPWDSFLADYYHALGNALGR